MLVGYMRVSSADDRQTVEALIGIRGVGFGPG